LISIWCGDIDGSTGATASAELIIERRTRDREVAGESLAYCVVEYGPSPGRSLTLICLCEQYNLIWY